jgi:serine/threonine protein kinase
MSSQAGHPSARSEPNVPLLDASRFELLEAIGSGGMGTVYRARQRSVDRYVAVKMLAPEHAANASGLARFVREANAIARLNHPNIVQLIDFGRDTASGNLLLVMELLEGESLRALMRREHRLAPDRAAYVAVQCLNALRAAHASGVIHRDLKPENIFIHHVGDDDHVKVLDFGVAKLTQSEVGDNTTQGSLVGTLRYMAPEQIAGETPDLRIDVYAMGVLLYEMLSGAMPYDTRDRYNLLRAIIADPPRHLLEAAPNLDPALASVVMRAIDKAASARWQTADEFRRALMPFLGESHARMQSLSDASGRFRHPGQAVSVGGGEHPSGIVRSGSSAGPSSATRAERPAGRLGASSPAPVDSEVLRGAMQQAIAPAGYTSAASQPQPPSRLPWLLLGAVLLLAGLGAAAVRLASRPTRIEAVDAPSSGGASSAAQPAPEAPGAPVAPVPAAAARMVLLSTTPPGARVLDPQTQRELCAQTPCAVAVPVAGGRAVRVVLGEASLDAMLEPGAPSVALDLQALAAPSPAPGTVTAPPTPSAPPERSGRRRPSGGRGGERGGDDDIPMLLPSGGG